MRKIAVLTLIFVLMVSTAFAGMQTKLYEKITVTSSPAVGLTNPPEGCQQALIVCSTNDIMFRRDGTDPTSTTGIPLEAGQNFVLDNYADIVRFKAIAVSTTAYLHVEYRVKY